MDALSATNPMSPEIFAFKHRWKVRRNVCQDWQTKA